MQGRWLLLIFTISLHAASANKPKPGELIFFPDALAGEHVYRVIGPASGESERCASEDIANPDFQHSGLREVSFVAYRWPRRTDLLAVLQYDFVGASPAGACTSIGRIVHLSMRDSRWTVVGDREVERTHHNGFERVELADLSGDGIGELLVESDWGGGGTTGSSLHIYSIESGRLEQSLETIARVLSFDGAFMQVLDIPTTQARNATVFCFRKTEYVDADGKLFRKPRVSLPCYPRGWNEFK